MKKQKNGQSRYRAVPCLSNEEGSVLLVTLVILILVTFMGINGVSTAVTDLRISRNYMLHKENMMLADAAVNQVMVTLEKELEENRVGRDWVNDIEMDGIYLVEDLMDIDDKYFTEGSNYRHLRHPVTNAIDIGALREDWDVLDASAAPVKLDGPGSDLETEYVAFIQISTGELDTRNTSAVVIARARKNGGDAIVERGTAYIFN